MMPSNNNRFVSDTGTYVANGNSLGVVMLQNDFADTDFTHNAEFCQWLGRWGQWQSVDSVMVMRQFKNTGISTDVFEPWAQISIGLQDSWSTMCGNGMMAATLFYQEHVAALDEGQSLNIHTRSGARRVTRLSQGRYSVCMGSFTHEKNDLSEYVRISNQSNPYILSAIPTSLGVNFSNQWSIGLSGDRLGNDINGEPHVVMINASGNKMSPRALRRIAVSEGPSISKNRHFFPQEINASFVEIEHSYSEEHGLSVLACTHERGLGDNPERSITGACGTGATAIGATLYKAYDLPDGCPIHIKMPGGTLMVRRRRGQFYLIGSAKRS